MRTDDTQPNGKHPFRNVLVALAEQQGHQEKA
jgi:hypothetical protein